MFTLDRAEENGVGGDVAGAQQGCSLAIWGAELLRRKLRGGAQAGSCSDPMGNGLNPEQHMMAS